MAKIPKTMKFEAAMKRFEELIEKLEDGRASLDDSLKIFEEGMELSQFCEKKLIEAEGKIKVLMKSGDETSESTLESIDDLKN